MTTVSETEGTAAEGISGGVVGGIVVGIVAIIIVLSVTATVIVILTLRSRHGHYSTETMQRK